MEPIWVRGEPTSNIGGDGKPDVDLGGMAAGLPDGSEVGEGNPKSGGGSFTTMRSSTRPLESQPAGAGAWSALRTDPSARQLDKADLSRNLLIAGYDRRRHSKSDRCPWERQEVPPTRPLLSIMLWVFPRYASPSVTSLTH